MEYILIIWYWDASGNNKLVHSIENFSIEYNKLDDIVDTAKYKIKGMEYNESYGYIITTQNVVAEG